MKKPFHPTTWIDEQRSAGGAGSNVFDEILAASASIRRGLAKHADFQVERRAARVQQIRREAAAFDAQVAPRDPATQSFSQMVERWKRAT